MLPRQPDDDEQATTGRGMSLIAAVTAEHGISDIGPDGKTVWFTVSGPAAEQSDDDLPAAWAEASWELDDLVDAPAPAAVVRTTRTVRLLGLPPALWLAARQHHDGLLRELALYLAEHGGTGLDVNVPAAARARTFVSTAIGAQVQETHHAGSPRRGLSAGPSGPLPAIAEPLNLEVQVPVELGPAFAALQDTLDAAERLARGGRLRVRPGLPEVVAIRDWLCEQVAGQFAGLPPRPWPGIDQERFTADVEGAYAPPFSGWDISVVRDSPRGVVAADDTNRIVAISRVLADALGWAPDELVGRRVVVLVPHRLREAHIAGFTSHLSTGASQLLDVPLSLPVLCADGTEITADFLIEQAPTSQGRAVYLAWIQPRPSADELT